MNIVQVKLPYTDPAALKLIRAKPGKEKQGSLWGLPISDLARRIPGEGILSVAAKVTALKKDGFSVMNFCIGQPDFDTPTHVKEKMVWAINSRKNTYTPPEGLPDTLEAAAHYMNLTRDGVNITKDDVCIYHGLKTTIRQVIECVANPGDEVIYPVPGFPAYEAQLRMQGMKPVPLYLRIGNGFQIAIDDLARKITKKTKLLILNSPSNPTGAMYDFGLLEEIAALAKRFGFRIYSDECYSRITFGKQFCSIASVPGAYPYTIVAEGISKSHAFTGYRAGALATGDRELMKMLRADAMSGDSCPSQLSQWGLIAAAYGPMDETERMVQSYRERRDLMVPLLNKVAGFNCPIPDGAFYAYVDVTAALGKMGMKNAEQLETLLLENGVAALADTRFGTKQRGDRTHCLRFSLVAPPEDIVLGMQRVTNVIDGKQVVE